MPLSLSLSFSLFRDTDTDVVAAYAALDNELPSGSQERISPVEMERDEGTAITRNSQVL